MRVHPDVADVLSLIEPHVLPCFARVGRFIDAVAPVDRTADHAHVARPHVNDFGFRWGNRYCAHRRDAYAVKDRIPDDSAIDRLPDAPARSTHVIDSGIAGNAGDGRDAACAERSDLPPAHSLVKAGVRSLPHQWQHDETESNKKRL